jgi:PEP-CTERM/exosortase A-associated glycosyltransferase
MRVLHVLHHSLPVLDGYSVRTSYILRNETAQGMNVAGVTSAQHPFPDAPAEVIDGVTIDRTPPYDGSQLPLWREWRLMAQLERQVTAAARRFLPTVIHAHSPVLVGHPAMRVARALGIPFVYEIRDLWENASVDRGRFSEGSVWYRLARGFETRVLRRADAVITICDALRQELASRLPAADMLFVVANGVDTASFTPIAPSEELRARWNLSDKEVIGYVGTFQPYEGLDLLVQALPAIVAQRPRVHLIIAGGGDGETALRREVRNRDVERHVTLCGRLPHDQVRQVYALTDVLVYPRRLTRTTALTTPLKPLEAMAMGRAVLISDVPAMRELVQPGITGEVFRAGDADDLAASCVRLLADPDLRSRCGAAARAWVVQEREWSRNVREYRNIYDRVARES